MINNDYNSIFSVISTEIIPFFEHNYKVSLDFLRLSYLRKISYLILFSELINNAETVDIFAYHDSVKDYAFWAFYDFYTIQLIEKSWSFYQQKTGILLDSGSPKNLWQNLEISATISYIKILLTDPNLILEKRNAIYRSYCKSDTAKYKQNLKKSYSPYYCFDEPFRTANQDFYELKNFAQNSNSDEIKLAYCDYLKSQELLDKQIKYNLTNKNRIAYEYYLPQIITNLYIT